MIRKVVHQIIEEFEEIWFIFTDTTWADRTVISVFFLLEILLVGIIIVHLSKLSFI